MSYIAWDASKELGHEKIDAEHQELLVHINRLVDIVFGVGPDREDPCRGVNRRLCIEAAVGALQFAATEHFSSEEVLMAGSDYPSSRVHAEAHADLLEQLDGFAAHFHSTSADSLPHAVRFLREWFEFHIDTYDRGLVRWLNGERILSTAED